MEEISEEDWASLFEVAQEYWARQDDTTEQQ